MLPLFISTNVVCYLDDDHKCYISFVSFSRVGEKLGHSMPIVEHNQKLIIEVITSLIIKSPIINLTLLLNH